MSTPADISPDAPRAVALLSGGVDSVTAAAVAIADGFTVHPIAFDYGQRHSVELTAARRAAAQIGALEPVVFSLDLRLFGGSALTDAIDVPKDRDADEIESGIPVTYVPACNLIFLSIAVAYAETLGSSNIYLGVNAVDYSGYPDCRPEFIASFDETANLATKLGVEGTEIKIHTPLIDMTKADIVRTGTELGVDYSLTHSCYDPSPEGLACGRCDSCALRRRGFAEAGLPDPTRYADGGPPSEQRISR